MVGLGAEILNVRDGTTLLVDGTTGIVISNPSSDLLTRFDIRIQAEREQRTRDTASALEPAITKDGHRMEIAANVGDIADTRDAVSYGAEGIGLLRTEFLFLNRKQSPDEHTQFRRTERS